LNPVRAGLAEQPADWPYSSLRAHLRCENDGLVDVSGLRGRVSDWTAFLDHEASWSERTQLRRHECSGIPLGDERFLAEIEALTGRELRPDFGWCRRRKGKHESRPS
jgi:putative transposase